MATNSLRFGYCYGNSSRGPRGTPGIHGPTGATGPGITALLSHGEIYDVSNDSLGGPTVISWGTGDT